MGFDFGFWFLVLIFGFGFVLASTCVHAKNMCMYKFARSLVGFVSPTLFTGACKKIPSNGKEALDNLL